MACQNCAYQDGLQWHEAQAAWQSDTWQIRTRVWHTACGGHTSHLLWTDVIFLFCGNCGMLDSALARHGECVHGQMRVLCQDSSVVRSRIPGGGGFCSTSKICWYRTDAAYSGHSLTMDVGRSDARSLKTTLFVHTLGRRWPLNQRARLRTGMAKVQLPIGVASSTRMVPILWRQLSKPLWRMCLDSSGPCHSLTSSWTWAQLLASQALTLQGPFLLLMSQAGPRWQLYCRHTLCCLTALLT